MARTPKLGEGVPFAVVRKETQVPEDDQNTIQNAADVAKDNASRTIQDLAEQLKALREEVQALRNATGDIAAQAGKVVATGARVASDKAVSGAKVAGEKVATTVETYPISALLIASGVAFLLGRMSAESYRQPSYADYAGSALDQLKHRLHDLSGRLPPHLKSALRSSLR